MNGTCLFVDLAQVHPDGSRTINRRQLFYSWQLNYHTQQQNDINKAKLVSSNRIAKCSHLQQLFLTRSIFHKRSLCSLPSKNIIKFSFFLFERGRWAHVHLKAQLRHNYVTQNTSVLQDSDDKTQC